MSYSLYHMLGLFIQRSVVVEVYPRISRCQAIKCADSIPSDSWQTLCWVCSTVKTPCRCCTRRGVEPSTLRRVAIAPATYQKGHFYNEYYLNQERIRAWISNRTIKDNKYKITHQYPKINGSYATSQWKLCNYIQNKTKVGIIYCITISVNFC